MRPLGADPLPPTAVPLDAKECAHTGREGGGGGREGREGVRDAAREETSGLLSVIA